MTKAYVAADPKPHPDGVPYVISLRNIKPPYPERPNNNPKNGSYPHLRAREAGLAEEFGERFAGRYRRAAWPIGRAWATAPQRL